jgi:hypothetical protein
MSEGAGPIIILVQSSKIIQARNCGVAVRVQPAIVEWPNRALFPTYVCLAVMFGHNSRKDRSAPSDGESRQPLLSRSYEDSVQDEGVIFAIDNDEDDTDNIHSGNRSPQPERPEHSVRFQEEVQVIGPPLKSTIQSRETGEYPRTRVHPKS